MSDDKAVAVAKAGTKLAAEIVGEYADKRGLDPHVIGFGAMQAAAMQFLRAGHSPDDVAEIARDVANDVADKLVDLYDEHLRKRGDTH